MLPERSLVDIFLFISLFLLPWWLVAVFALGATVNFPRYRELVGFAFLYDLLYAPVEPSFFFSFTVSACVAYGIIQLLKRYTML